MTRACSRLLAALPRPGRDPAGHAVPSPAPDEVLVRTLYSGVSRGTETLVFRGGVPESQYAAMRAPFQEGDFPAPVKYGYLNVGVVEQGPPALRGRTVFCLYPHQTRYVVPASAVTVGAGRRCRPRRAVLAGTVETAVNALWDAAPLVGDRIAVVGAGMVGCCVAARAGPVPRRPGAAGRRRPGPGGGRRRARRRLRAARRTPPATATWSCTPAPPRPGWPASLELLAPEGTVVELSWYGDRPVSVPLGEFFHSRRLTVRSSQVGAVVAGPAGRRSFADRLALALELLADPGVRRADHRASAPSTSCPRCCPGWPAVSLPGLLPPA